MSDPFATWSDFGNTDIAVSQKNLTNAPASQVKVLLPLSLLMLCIYGATMPWVLIRPFSASIRTYNITDVPGGIGILWTVICLSIPGIVLLLFRKQSGLFVVGLAAGVLGWMGTVLGLLLGVITSIIPSIDLAGIDMAKAQAGQGPGVPITVLASVILGIIVVQRMNSGEQIGPKISVPVVPLVALVPLVLLAINHHVEWLTLGVEGGGFRAEIPGDALYGSGILLAGMWLAIASWIMALVMKSRIVVVICGVLSVLVGVTCVLYSLAVWVGGKALGWIIPSSVGDWSSVKVEMALYLSLGGGVVLFVAGISSLIPAISNKSVSLSTDVDISKKRFFVSEVIGAIVIICVVIAVLVRALA